MGIGLRRCRIGHNRCGNLAQAFLQWESSLELHIFLHLFFLLELYFPITSKKESSNFVTQSPNLPFQYAILEDPQRYDGVDDSTFKQ